MMNKPVDYSLYQRIYMVVRQIPSGKVATYGDIAAIVGCEARTVGYALGELDERADETPWQRVINKQGGISTHGLLQRQLLEAEGVEFNQHDQVYMARFHWTGPDPAWAT
ncbi:MAG: MGMT family protein, partial [Chloroflexales bacterium]|nr:MGMT family protein [Chloroflexales bacterium]